MIDWKNLAAHAFRLHSQSGEEGIIAAIFDAIGTTNRYAIEFGAGDGFTNSNTRSLRQEGWGGLMLEADPQHASSMVKTEFVTAENVDGLLTKHGAPQSPDLISIDVDGNDWWIWKALARTPRVVVIEFNRMWPESEAMTILYDPEFRHDGTDYHGASLGALRKLGRKKGYTLVGHRGVNLFFVQDACLDPHPGEIDMGFTPVREHPPDKSGRPWATAWAMPVATL